MEHTRSRPARPRKAPPVSVLIVAADFADVVMIREALSEARSRAFELVHTKRLAEALEQLSQRDFDAVLLDPKLPDSRGLPTLERLLAHRSPPPPVVVLSHPREEESALRAVRAGARDYLVKGQFEPRFLLRTLQSAIERHGLARELDQSKQREQYLATHDALTRLPNRFLFRVRLAQSLAQARRHDTQLALLTLDLDGFKAVNESLGHSVGDLLLQEVARRLNRSLRSTDTAARVSGDEFAVILTGIGHAHDAARVAGTIARSLSAPVLLAGTDCSARASTGIALYPSDGLDAETLLVNAEAARLQAKRSAPGTYRFYASDATSQSHERLALERDLEGALERGELGVAFEPRFDAGSGRVAGSEARLRWRHPRRGAVPTAELIALTEESPVRRAIDEWSLREACSRAADWQFAGAPRLPISVDVSARQLAGPDLADAVEAALLESCLDAGDLELEVPESGLARDLEASAAALARLRELGVRVCLDGFGAGPLPAGALGGLPADAVKLDASLVRGCARDAEGARIAGAVLALAAHLGLDLAADGVETPEQAHFLRERGCRILQGPLFSPPLDAGDFEALLRGGRPAAAEKPDDPGSPAASPPRPPPG